MEISSINRFYDQQLDENVYSQKGGRTNHETVVRLIRRADLRNPSVLDLGCGDGAVAQALADSGLEWSRYIGIDSNPRLLSIFKSRNLPSVDLHKGDATGLEFLTSTFDVVLSVFMLEHLDDKVGTSHLQIIGELATGALLLAAPLVLDSESIKYIGEQGSPNARTPKWNWGELAVRSRLRSVLLTTFDFEAFYNPNGVIHEYYLLARHATQRA